MAIAAVPNYLGEEFSDSSPGLRFGMYFQGWRSDFSKETGNVEVLKRAGKLNPNDQAAMKYLLVRQQAAFNAATGAVSGLQLDAIATAPFSTGLGNEHPTENGFAFLNPYGLPYLPGSGVKGVLRQAARELASGDWGDSYGWSDKPQYSLTANGKPVLDKKKQPIMLTMLDVLFGRETTDGDSEHLRGALIFWDVIPQIPPESPQKPDEISLSVDIMTPHQKHYYQEGKNPHDSGQPNPITFLTVPPGSGFTFHVQCNLALLENTAPALTRNDQWQQLLQAAFNHAFDWLGFGAMAEDHSKKAAREEQQRQQQEEERQKREQAARQQEIANMNPVDKAIAEYLDARADKNQPEINALLAGLKAQTWGGEIATGVAQHLKARMQAEKKWRESSQKKNPNKDKDYVNTQLVMEYLK